MTNNHILITGSAGFIGFSVSLELLKQGHKVVGIDNHNDYYLPAIKEARYNILNEYENFTERRINIDDYEAMESVFKEFKISCVLNLAAQAGVRHSLTHPFVYEKTNILGFLNLAELVRHYKVPRFVYASSSSVYGGNTKMPFSESDTVDTPVSLYAASKKSNELIAYSYTHLYGFQSIGLRFFTVYGPWGRPDMAMWLFAEAIETGKKMKVFNNGDMRRDFTYIDDIVQGVVAAIFTDGLDQYEIINIGNNKSEPLMKMISIIEQELGKEGEKELLPMQPGDVKESFADIEKAQKKLSYSPSTTLEKGIPAFISWYKENKDLVDQVIKSR